MRDAEEVAKKIAAHDQWQARKKQRKDLQEESDVLTKRLDALRADRADHLSGINLGIAGVAMGEHGLTVNGVPFLQLSGGEQMRVSSAIGIALNPELRVMLVQRGESLDDEAFAEVAKMAGESGVQLWVATVGNGHGDALQIEAGELK